jgi:hypothetical protein
MNASPSTPGIPAGRFPWRTLAFIGLIYLVTASGRSSNADVELMLAQSRAFMAGQIHLLPDAAGGRGSPGLEGFLYCHYGIGASLFWVPFLGAGRLLAHLVGRLPVNAWEELMVSFSPALVAVAVLAVLARIWIHSGTPDRRVRSGLWLFGLGTLLWPYSKLIGSDLLMALFLMAGIATADRNPGPGGRILAGLFWAAAFLTRKQMISVLPCLILWTAWLGWRGSAGAAESHAPRFRQALKAGTQALIPILGAVAFKLWWNRARFGGWLVEPYPGSDNWTVPTVAEFAGRLSGQLVDGGRGQLWFNGFGLMVALLALTTWWRRRRSTLLVAVGCGLSTWLFFGLMAFWPGGVSFGPRLQLLLTPLCAIAWAYLPVSLSLARRILLGAALGVTLLVGLPGVFVDPVAIEKHREWILEPGRPQWLAGWGEMRAVFGLGRPKMVPGLDPSAYTLEKHPTFQNPDLWWWHAAKVLRRPPAADTAPNATPSP